MAERWEVVGQRETTGTDAAGRFTRVIEVSFRTPTGFVGSVQIPFATYNADTARSAIDAYVDRVEGVAGL